VRLFLGVDGGQSSTTALIGDETGRVIAVGHAGPCNHVGAAEGRARFLAAIGGCLKDAGHGDSHFESACLGFSGGPKDKDSLTREIVHAEKYVITNDAVIALAGATGGKPGVVVIAGTGSIALGRNSESKTAHAGGWGYIFGDEGGGFDIVRHALRASLRFEEGWGPQTALREAMLTATEATDSNDLLHRFYTDEYPRARAASLAKLVDETARAGDATAGDILRASAQTLATLAGAVRRQLFAPGELLAVSYIGGVFRSGIVRERFRLLIEMEDGNRVAAPIYGPAAGALIEAYRIAGISYTIRDTPPEKT
jgi:N-acetylglucosamine kinase-like BadF-type ATPase